MAEVHAPWWFWTSWGLMVAGVAAFGVFMVRMMGKAGSMGAARHGGL